MTCEHLIEVTRELLPAERVPGCKRRNPRVIVIDCELYGRVTTKPARDRYIRCCRDCEHNPDR